MWFIKLCLKCYFALLAFLSLLFLSAILMALPVGWLIVMGAVGYGLYRLKGRYRIVRCD